MKYKVKYVYVLINVLRTERRADIGMSVELRLQTKKYVCLEHNTYQKGSNQDAKIAPLLHKITFLKGLYLKRSQNLGTKCRSRKQSGVVKARKVRG